MPVMRFCFVGILPCELIPQQMATVVQVLAADEIVFDGVPAGRLHLANFAPVLGRHQLLTHIGICDAAAAQVIQLG